MWFPWRRRCILLAINGEKYWKFEFWMAASAAKIPLVIEKKLISLLNGIFRTHCTLNIISGLVWIVGINIDWALYACGHFPVGKNKHVIRGRHKNLICYLVLSIIFRMDYYIQQWKIMTFFYTNRVSSLKNKCELSKIHV